MSEEWDYDVGEVAERRSGERWRGVRDPGEQGSQVVQFVTRVAERKVVSPLLRVVAALAGGSPIASNLAWATDSSVCQQVTFAAVRLVVQSGIVRWTEWTERYAGSTPEAPRRIVAAVLVAFEEAVRRRAPAAAGDASWRGLAVSLRQLLPELRDSIPSWMIQTARRSVHGSTIANWVVAQQSAAAFAPLRPISTSNNASSIDRSFSSRVRLHIRVLLASETTTAVPMVEELAKSLEEEGTWTQAMMDAVMRRLPPEAARPWVHNGWDNAAATAVAVVAASLSVPRRLRADPDHPWSPAVPSSLVDNNNPLEQLLPTLCLRVSAPLGVATNILRFARAVRLILSALLYDDASEGPSSCGSSEAAADLSTIPLCVELLQRGVQRRALYSDVSSLLAPVRLSELAALHARLTHLLHRRPWTNGPRAGGAGGAGSGAVASRSPYEEIVAHYDTCRRLVAGERTGRFHCSSYLAESPQAAGSWTFALGCTSCTLPIVHQQAITTGRQLAAGPVLTFLVVHACVVPLLTALAAQDTMATDAPTTPYLNACSQILLGTAAPLTDSRSCTPTGVGVPAANAVYSGVAAVPKVECLSCVDLSVLWNDAPRRWRGPLCAVATGWSLDQMVDNYARLVPSTDRHRSVAIALQGQARRHQQRNKRQRWQRRLANDDPGHDDVDEDAGGGDGSEVVLRLPAAETDTADLREYLHVTGDPSVDQHTIETVSAALGL